MRAAIAGTPKVRSRDLISPAARAVNVRARIRFGSTIPISTAYANRWVIARVFPVPAPAMTQTGPRTAVATARCSSSNAARISSAADIAPTLFGRQITQSIAAVPGINHRPSNRDCWWK